MTPADISIDFKTYETKGYRLVMIAEPTQKHVVGWEQASRAMKNEDSKPFLHRILAELKKIDVTENNLSSVMAVFVFISDLLQQAIKILDDNESLTLSSNRGVMVKAAIKSGWIISLEKLSDPDQPPERIMKTESEVDGLKPWLVRWIAEQVASLYLEVTEIPKN